MITAAYISAICPYQFDEYMQRRCHYCVRVKYYNKPTNYIYLLGIIQVHVKTSCAELFIDATPYGDRDLGQHRTR